MDSGEETPVQEVSQPRWTVGFNWQPIGRDTPPGVMYPRNSWCGTGWLFFDDESVAKEWYKRLDSMGIGVAFMRPFYKSDWDHVGAAHKRPANYHRYTQRREL